MRRTGFTMKGKPVAARDPDRVRVTPRPTSAFRLGTPAELTARPNTEPRRNPFLLTMARGQQCLLAIPGVCNRDRETTVAAHSNWAEHGKAGARKADDCYSVWACSACHSLIDQGKEHHTEKRRIWDGGFAWMRGIWMDVAYGMQPATPKEKAAAQWALDEIEKDRKKVLAESSK